MATLLDGTLVTTPSAAPASSSTSRSGSVLAGPAVSTPTTPVPRESWSTS